VTWQVHLLDQCVPVGNHKLCCTPPVIYSRVPMVHHCTSVDLDIAAEPADESTSLNTSSMRALSRVVLSWLEQHDMQHLCAHPLKDIEQHISGALDLLARVLKYFSCHERLLTVVIKYASTFVASNGVRQVVLLHLLLISAIVTIKMWGTENMAVNQIVADLFKLAIVDVNNMEREFLKSLDYKLYVRDTELATYHTSIIAAMDPLQIAAQKDLPIITTHVSVQAAFAPPHKRKVVHQHARPSYKHAKSFLKPEIFV